jgi:hypothetical protein
MAFVFSFSSSFSSSILDYDHEDKDEDVSVVKSTTQGKPAAFNGKPAKLITDFSVSNFDKY